MDPYNDPSAGLMAGIFAALFIPLLIITVIMVIGMWKIFTKAGKPGWAAIIPLYNIIVLLEIVGKPIWWLFMFLIPCVNIIFAIWMTNLLSKSFGQSEGFTIGLLLLPYIFYPLLGFGSYKYIGPAGAAPAYPPYHNPNDPFNQPPQV